jgi:hypothetical protein
MLRRSFLAGLPLTALAAPASVSLRGKLLAGVAPRLGAVQVKGDEPTMGVLADDRLNGADFEALGSKRGDVFEIDKIHTRSLFVHQGGKRLMVTYWCDVCYIRTYTPGKCWCCQKDTDLDLRESLQD